MLIDTTHYYHWPLEDKLCSRFANRIWIRKSYSPAWKRIMNAKGMPAQASHCISDQVRRTLKESMYANRYR